MKIKVGDMKVEAATFVKHLWSVVREKSNDLKDKADAMKTKVLLLGFLKNKNILGAISSKVTWPHGWNIKHRLSGKFKLGGHHPASDIGELSSQDQQQLQLQELELLFGGTSDSAAASPRNSPAAAASINSSKCGTPEIKSDNEIDKIASAFIKRFHKQMKLQKQQSYKTYQAMLARSV